MRVIILGLLLLAVSGCKQDKHISDYRCSEDQLELVKSETDFCSALDDAIATKCYEFSKKSQCDYIGVEN